MDVVTFSDLQLKGKTTVERLQKSPGCVLLVRRRDAEDLILTTVSRADQQRKASSATAHMLAALMQHDNRIGELMMEVLPEVFPWAAFLSDDEVQQFAVELVATMRAAESIDNPAPVVQVIESWQHTAQVWADTQLAAVLQAPSSGDYGAVLPPRGA